MTTTVCRVNGLDPSEFCGNDQNRYVGRYIYLQSGRHKGSFWPNSGFGNWYRFENGFTRAQKVELLFRYVERLADALNTTSMLLRQPFLQLAGKRLGCWCLDWDGIAEPLPPCHACWLARIVDVLEKTHRCVITPAGEIDDMPLPSGPWVSFERRENKMRIKKAKL